MISSIHQSSYVAFRRLLLPAVCSCLLVAGVSAQQTTNTQSAVDTLKKANARPPDAPVNLPEPFDGVPVEQMAGQCVTLQTELGEIEIAMMPEVAPESVRNFLNLSATGALDTTTFSRVVKDL